MEKLNENKIKNLIGLILIAIAGYAAVIIALQARGGDVWYDELYSVEMGKMTYKQIVDLTSIDVHPPMYYWYLKTFESIVHASDYVASCKFASFIPYLGMVVLALTMIRKRWGMLTAGLFVLMITVMPNMPTYYVEIRMYSFAMLFALIQGIMLTDMLNHERNKGYKWFIFFFSSVIVAYTQYFALVAAGGLYLVLLICSFRDKENGRKHRLGFMGMTICAVISYIPWVPFMIKQINEVVGAYWIAPLGLKSLPGCLKYLFLAQYSTAGYIIAALMIIVFAVVYIIAIYKHSQDISTEIWLAGPVALICMLIVAYFFSIMGSPIFVYRYMISYMPVFYLGIAIMLAKENNIIGCIALILIFVTGYKVMGGFYYEENKKLTQYAHAEEVLESIPSGSMIVTNFEQVTAASAYYLRDCDAYFYDEFVVDPLLARLFEDNTYELRGEDIAPYIENKYDNVYYFGTGHEREAYVENWEQQGIKVTLLDECLIERYWINVYKLELE